MKVVEDVEGAVLATHCNTLQQTATHCNTQHDFLVRMKVVEEVEGAVLVTNCNIM